MCVCFTLISIHLSFFLFVANTCNSYHNKSVAVVKNQCCRPFRSVRSPSIPHSIHSSTRPLVASVVVSAFSSSPSLPLLRSKLIESVWANQSKRQPHDLISLRLDCSSPPPFCRLSNFSLLDHLQIFTLCSANQLAHTRARTLFVRVCVRIIITGPITQPTIGLLD